MICKPTTILYAEDDEEDRFLFLEGVRCIDENIRIITAENGQEVLRYLLNITTDQEIPLAIVSDLRMPLCDGLDMLRRVKQELRWQQIPVILFSTSSSHADVSAATRLGVEAFFTKPGTQKEFMKTVKKKLEVCNK